MDNGGADLVARLMEADTLHGFTDAERFKFAASTDPEVVRRYYDLGIQDALRKIQSERAAQRRLPKPKPSRWGILHLHREHVPGCYRCDLREDEADA